MGQKSNATWYHFKNVVYSLSSALMVKIIYNHSLNVISGKELFIAQEEKAVVVGKKKLLKLVFPDKAGRDTFMKML